MDDMLLALFNQPEASDTPAEREIRDLMRQAHAAEERGISAEMIWMRARALVGAHARQQSGRTRAHRDMLNLKAALATIWEQYPTADTVAELLRQAPEARALRQRSGSTSSLLTALEHNTREQLTRVPAPWSR
jgi:hypothetical protein